MKITNAANISEEYDILANFPFSSETKRMGILVRQIETGRLIFYLKGADIIMQTKVTHLNLWIFYNCFKVKKVFKSVVEDECENLAREGLRTLVIAQKPILEEEYQEWKIKFDKANLALINRHQAIRDCAELLESDMDFLGVSGVEDKLQENVCSSIEALRHAGIHVISLLFCF